MLFPENGKDVGYNGIIPTIMGTVYKGNMMESHVVAVDQRRNRGWYKKPTSQCEKHPLFCSPLASITRGYLASYGFAASYVC